MILFTPFFYFADNKLPVITYVVQNPNDGIIFEEIIPSHKVRTDMKKIYFYLSMFAAVCILAVSCETEPITFDESLLIGKWQSGTLFYKYLEDGTGGTWDTADDVTEEEAQEFTWTLVNDELTQNHILEIGGTVPKLYTVTVLTAATLKYHDDFGVEFAFTKVTI
jgi:hypothetical protein